MSMINFAEDFARLVMRYTKVFPLKINQPTIPDVPLTHKEIMLTVRHVLYGLGIKESDDNNDNSQITTPDNEFVINFPEITSELKINHKQEDKSACRSEDAQPAIMILGASVSNTSQKTSGNEAEISSNMQDEIKFISRPNPTICVNRSDTFVCKDNQNAKNNDLEDVFEDGSTNIISTGDLCDRIIEPLGKIWESTMSTLTKLDDLKTSFPQLNKKIQQLSLKNNFSPCASSKDAIVRKSTNKIRRSITTLPVLSTSIEQGDRRKSTGGIVCKEKDRKSNESKKVTRATSNLNLSTSSKTSSNSPRIVKNPKYAHVRSTIPKPISQSKRKQQ